MLKSNFKQPTITLLAALLLAPLAVLHAADASKANILLHAGDLSSHGWFARFREILRACPLVVAADKGECRFGEGRQHIAMFRYDLAARKSFSQPRINGTPIDLHPAAVYQSPFLNGVSNSSRITVTLGPVRQILDFASQP